LKFIHPIQQGVAGTVQGTIVLLKLLFCQNGKTPKKGRAHKLNPGLPKIKLTRIACIFVLGVSGH